MDSLALERVTQDSADQRAGRAARLGPGVVRRLWESGDRLRPHREPDIARVDLAAPLLDLLAWGADPASFEWFEAPPADRIDAGLGLLERLGAIERTGAAPRVTPLGRELQRVPLHPRLARILLDGRGAPDIAAACALLAEPLTLDASGVSTTCDLLPLLDRFERQPLHVRQVAQELRRVAERALDGELATASVRGCAAPRAVHGLCRPAREATARLRCCDGSGGVRPGLSARSTDATGHGAALARESGVRDAEYLVALDVVAAQRDGISEARIRAASRVEPDWIRPTSVARGTSSRPGRAAASGPGASPATTRLSWLNHRRPADPIAAAALLRDAWVAREPDARTTQLLRRLRFAGLDIDVPALVQQAATLARTASTTSSWNRTFPLKRSERWRSARPRPSSSRAADRCGSSTRKMGLSPRR